MKKQIIKIAVVFTATLAICLLGINATSTKAADQTIEVGVAKTVAISLSGTSSISNLSAPGVDNTTMAITATATSNVPAGYTVTLADSDAVTDLANTTGGTIPTQAGEPQSGTAGWSAGIKPNSTGTPVWNAMPASTGTAIEIASTSAVSGSSGDPYYQVFGVATAASTQSGTYSDTVVYTIVAK